MFLFFFCRDSGELLSLHPEFTALAELTGGVVVADYYCRCCFLPRVACRTASLAGPQDRQRLPQLEAGVRGWHCRPRAAPPTAASPRRSTSRTTATGRAA